MEPFFFDRALNDPTKTIRLYKMDEGSGKPAGLIVKGFLTEIPTLTISNDWGAAGSTFISSWVEQIGGMVSSPIGRRIMDIDLVKDIVNAVGGDGTANTIRKYQNAKITAIENLVKQYNGTSTNVALSEMKVALVVDKKGAKNPKDTVLDTLDVVVGSYDKKGSDLANNGIAGIQFAPNDYQVDYSKAMSGYLKGALVLEVGMQLQFRNVLVKDVQFNMSEYLAGDPSNYVAVWGGAEPAWSPMDGVKKPIWGEMTLTFDFAREFNRDDFATLLKQSPDEFQKS
jgi:hypothetical protein